MLSVCFSCLPCWLAEKSLSFSNGLDLKESLSDIWIFFLPFLDKMDIFENDCVCSSNLRVWGICKEFYYSLFCWENWWEWEWDEAKLVEKGFQAVWSSWGEMEWWCISATGHHSALQSVQASFTGCHLCAVNSHEEKKCVWRDFKCHDWASRKSDWAQRAILSW